MAIPLTPEILVDALKEGRRRGTITAQHPISATRLIRALSVRFDVDTNPREIRDVVNRLCDAGERVCSTSRGYFYALTHADMMVGIEFYSSYISEYTRRVTAMKRTAERLREPDADLFGHPLVAAIKNEFGAENIA